MMEVILSPRDAAGGGDRVFAVRGFDFDLETRQLVLWCHDGNICVELTGNWRFKARPPKLITRLHTIDEAERIQNESLLIHH